MSIKIIRRSHNEVRRTAIIHLSKGTNNRGIYNAPRDICIASGQIISPFSACCPCGDIQDTANQLKHW